MHTSALSPIHVKPPNGGGCGSVRPSRRARWRAASLIFVYVLFALHIWHWKHAGRTLTPVEPSEAIQTLNHGLVNLGFILLIVLILSTLVLGRFFCGWACHIVALQDLCTWILRKMGIQPRPFRSRLLVFVPLLAAIYMFLGPIIVRTVQGTPAPQLQSHITTENFWGRFPGWAVGGLTFAVCGFLIVYVLGNKGFCTYGCPYGGIFGLADPVAPGRIRVTDACEGCGHCTATCTSNVRVHLEVKHHGMVVDPGCMKCMDCVSVCPKDALYYGFGAPAVAKGKPRGAPPPKRYDYVWPEEFILAGAFLFSIAALTTLYDKVPLLLALGSSSVSAYVLLSAWKLFRGGNVRVARRMLRQQGRVTPTGVAFGAVSVLWLGFLLHSGIVQYSKLHGLWQYKRASSTLLDHPNDPVALAALEKALIPLERTDRWGFLSTPNVQDHLARGYAMLGKQQQAEAHFRRLVELAPDYSAAHFQLAAYAKARGEVDVAIAELLEVVRIEPHYAAAHQELASALVAQGRALEAVTVLETLVERDPSNVEIQLTLSSVLARVGRTNEALEHCDFVLELQPDNPNAYVRRAQILGEIGQYDESIALLQHALALDANLAFAHYALGVVQLHMADTEAASASFGEALRLEPFSALYARAWAKLASYRGGLQDAIAAAAVETSREERFRLMYLLAAAGRVNDARQLAGELGVPEP